MLEKKRHQKKGRDQSIDDQGILDEVLFARNECEEKKKRHDIRHSWRNDGPLAAISNMLQLLSIFTKGKQGERDTEEEIPKKRCGGGIDDHSFPRKDIKNHPSGKWSNAFSSSSYRHNQRRRLRKRRDIISRRKEQNQSLERTKKSGRDGQRGIISSRNRFQQHNNTNNKI